MLGREAIRDDLFRVPVALHEFPDEFRCRGFVSSLCYVSFRRLALVFNGSPKVVTLAIDLHEQIVCVPLPLQVGPELLVPLPCSRSPTFQSNRGNRRYIITARRKIAWLFLKHLNRLGWRIHRGQVPPCPAQVRVSLTSTIQPLQCR